VQCRQVAELVAAAALATLIDERSAKAGFSGGDWGAFGAGVLKGWSRVHGPLAMPEFDVVTGVSTGALIAPFAFLGDAPSLGTIVELYRNPRPDLVKQRWPLYFLPANESFATVPGLERELRTRVDRAMLRRIADASRQGHFLLVNTTDADDDGSRVWDVGSAARYGEWSRRSRASHSPGLRRDSRGVSLPRH
jgi:hypothetical protein